MRHDIPRTGLMNAVDHTEHGLSAQYGATGHARPRGKVGQDVQREGIEGSAKIAVAVLQQRHGRDRGRFSAQNTRSQRQDLEMLRGRLVDLVCREPAFRPNQQGGSPRVVLVVFQCRTARLKHQLHRFIALFKPAAQRHRRMDDRQRGTPTLLAGTGRDRQPMLPLALFTFTLEAHVTALSVQRGDFRHSQLDRFLDGNIHAIALGDSLSQMHAQRRFRRHCHGFAQCYRHTLTVHDRQHAFELVTAAIEQTYGITNATTHDASNVMGLCVREGKDHSCGSCCQSVRIDVDAHRYATLLRAVR
ncbi:transcriptional regulator [Zymobacter palmae]|uniref:Transcriptional regulator n=1 Tax=Zymobacter palmae TaxID=33074 RepID=A0A348HBH3_9GAMM|nr:transcriptional regulator [Zymobacter palmae]